MVLDFIIFVVDAVAPFLQKLLTAFESHIESAVFWGDITVFTIPMSNISFETTAKFVDSHTFIRDSSSSSLIFSPSEESRFVVWKVVDVEIGERHRVIFLRFVGRFVEELWWFF